MAGKKLVLGLDIGIASCGWGLVDLDNQKIVATGVRCFEKAENPKDGASLALPRRQKRQLRRILKRKAQRMRALRIGFRKLGLISSSEPLDKCPWGLRVAALDRLLSGDELARVLLHIAKRRGYRAVSREEQDSDDVGRMLSAMNSTQQEYDKMREIGQARTIGEFLFKLPPNFRKRNGRDSYERTVKRQWLEDEVRKIFEAQRKFLSKIATVELEEFVLQTTFFQRPLKSVEHMVGFCTFEKSEKRAPKASWSFEYSMLLQKVNHLRVYEGRGKARPLSADEREKAIATALRTERVTYAVLRKKMNLPDDLRFEGVRYGAKAISEGVESVEKKERFVELKGYHTLRKKLGDDFDAFLSDKGRYDEVTWILSTEKDIAAASSALKRLELSDELISKLLGITFQGFGSLSVKVLREIIPYLESGHLYSEACESAGYIHTGAVSGSKGKYLPPIPEIPNPVVRRALSQSRKLINSVIREYGLPTEIHIELAREVAKTYQERRDIEKEQKKNGELRDQVRRELAELIGRDPKPYEVEKFKHLKEQSHRCAYSFREITIPQLMDSSATQIDHVIPYSRSFDDSWNNKVLVLTGENQLKKDRTPFEYISNGQGADSERWQEYIANVNSWFTNMSDHKVRNLLNSELSEEALDDWKSRSLNDTRYISRFLMQHCIGSLDFGDDGSRHVFARSGKITYHLRKIWGLRKDREADDRHHAQDAIVIACCSEGVLQAITKYYQKRELNILKNSEGKDLAPLPWETFRDDVIKTVSEVFVSRAPNRKITGPAHEDTIRSERFRPDGSRVVVETIPLSKLTKDNIDRIWDRPRNHRLYSALFDRMVEHKMDAEKAFSTPVYMPTNDPTKLGPEIKSVRIETKEKTGVHIAGQGERRKGFASNGSMVRADIFKKNGKYYIVPVYVADMVAGELPNKAVTAGVDRQDWPEMDDTFAFMFSLYPNDYVVAVKSGKITSGYYRGCDVATGAVSILPHAGGNTVDRIGIKNLSSFEKFTVDPLGRLSKVNREKRISGLANRGHHQPRKVAVPKSTT